MTALLFWVVMDGCRDLLVTHDDGRAECLDPACELPDLLHHEWRVGCTDLDEGCPRCAEPVADDRQWRAA